MEDRAMTAAQALESRDELEAAVAGAGQESAFAGLAERYRGELRVHCYRMLGSFEESEDLVQETFLRAWRKRESFEGRSSFRAWLYRIATNACLDALERRPRKAHADGAGSSEILWLQPYPDSLLDDVPTPEAGPEEAVVSKETIELAFLVAIQHLPPRQRAVLIVRDVLGWSAKETAALLETSVASANSALQRARATLKERLPERRAEWAPATKPTEDERALVQRYVDATDDADPAAFAEMLRDDTRWSMPPEPGVWVGTDAILGAWTAGGAFDTESFGHLRAVLTRANMQPAVACYHRRPGEQRYRPLALDVLRIEDGAVAEIVTFPGSCFSAFDLPQELR
jgi:RNA polymerase sigma-70 factor, ECF subfamily